MPDAPVPHDQPPGASDDVLRRMREGDRDAAAEYIRQHEPLLRRRFRHKLGAALRRVVDSEELISTLSRRLNEYVATGKLNAANQEQLWALVIRIAERSVSDKLRDLKRSENPNPPAAMSGQEGKRAGRYGELATELDAEASIEEILGLVPESDRQIVIAWLRGTHFNAIAEQIGMSEEGVRQRWHRIKRDLRGRFEARKRDPSDLAATEGAASLTIQIEIPDGASESQVIEAIRELSVRADDFHRALGGKGLRIKDLQIEELALVREGAL